MSFFEEVDALGVAEQHIQKLQKLEDHEAKRVLRRYKEIRQELRDRLDATRSDSFTAQQLRGALVQVELALATMGRDLKADMKDSAGIAAKAGVDDLLREISVFEDHFMGAVVPINVNAVAIASDAENLLFNQYQSSIDAYSEAVRSQLASQITQSAIEQIPYSTLIQRMSQFFIGEEWKLHRIARTELHNVYGIGKLNTMSEIAKEQMPDLKKTLIHPMDDRTAKDSIFADNLNLIVNIDEPFVYKWRGKKRVYMAPPDRPNDRSILVPYRDSWS